MGIYAARIFAFNKLNKLVAKNLIDWWNSKSASQVCLLNHIFFPFVWPVMKMAICCFRSEGGKLQANSFTHSVMIHYDKYAAYAHTCYLW